MDGQSEKCVYKPDQKPDEPGLRVFVFLFEVNLVRACVHVCLQVVYGCLQMLCTDFKDKTRHRVGRIN